MVSIPWTPRLQAAVGRLGASSMGPSPWPETVQTAGSSACWAPPR